MLINGYLEKREIGFGSVLPRLWLYRRVLLFPSALSIGRSIPEFPRITGL